MHVLDTDQNGVIEWADFEQILQSAQVRQAAMVGPAAQPGPRLVDPQVLRKRFEEVWATLRKACDINNSGRITTDVCLELVVNT